MSQQLHMPPAACPNDGICMSLPAKIESLEASDRRHEGSMSELSGDLNTLKKDVHEIKITLRERDKMQEFLKTVFVGMLICFVGGMLGILGQVGLTVYYSGGVKMQLDQVIASVVDHEQRIRTEERKNP